MSFKLCGTPCEDFWGKYLPHAVVFRAPSPYKKSIAQAFKEFPAAIGLLETLYSIDPANHGTAADALNSEFFTTMPLGCDLSSLPRYPPRTEISGKMQDEQAIWPRAKMSREQRPELDKKRSKVQSEGQSSSDSQVRSTSTDSSTLPALAEPRTSLSDNPREKHDLFLSKVRRFSTLLNEWKSKLKTDQKLVSIRTKRPTLKKKTS